VGETHGNDASRKGSALEGAEQFDPCGVGRVDGGRRPWAAGTKSVPWPTATQVEPLRGWDGDRDKRKARGHGVIPLCGTQLIKPPACGRCLTVPSATTCNELRQAALGIATGKVAESTWACHMHRNGVIGPSDPAGPLTQGLNLIPRARVSTGSLQRHAYSQVCRSPEEANGN